MDILVYGLSERKRALRTVRMASSVGYMVVDAEVETRSTRSPDETALDGDAIGERPLPEVQWCRWWLRMEVCRKLLSLSVTSRSAISDRPAHSAVCQNTHLGIFSDKRRVNPTVCSLDLLQKPQARWPQGTRRTRPISSFFPHCLTNGSVRKKNQATNPPRSEEPLLG